MIITPNLSIWTMVSWLLILFLIVAVYRLEKRVDRIDGRAIEEQKAAVERRRKELKERADHRDDG